MRQRWSTNADPPIDLAAIARDSLVVLGASGAGKTTIVSALVQMFDRTAIVRMATTRPPRADDIDGHYDYVSKAAFDSAATAGSYFLCRHEPYPQYGWLRDHLISIGHSGNIPVFVFRHGGLRVIMELIPRACLVLIKASPQVAAVNALDRVDRPTEDAARGMDGVNEDLCGQLALRGWPHLVINNRFEGPEEISGHAVAVWEFLRQHRS